MTDLFEAKAADWDANDRRTRLAAAIGATMLERVQLHKHMKVMDFGAGTGLVAAQIAPLVEQLVAVDTSPAMLEKLAAKAELEGRVETVCRDILEQPLDTRFDLIVSAMTLHHVEDTSRLLQRFNQQLKPSGKLALADLDKEDGSFHAEGTEGIFHFGFDRDELRAELESQGFEKIEFFTAHTMERNQREYPVFLVTATKA
ncbi:MAG TPA: methyltransferase domain-containing protein [Gammaproteobacteria bacterium]|nr:methyltransferase domain-containing protein [Gammaproteobacteria bacterium]